MNNTKFKYIIVALIAFTGKACYCAAWNPGTQPNMGDQQMATTTERHALESLAGQIVDAAEREDQEEISRLANVAIAANIATKKDIFDQMPAEVIEKVAISLPPKSWVRMSLVSRTFKRFIRDWPLYQFLNPYLNEYSGELIQTLYYVKSDHPEKIEVINYLQQHIADIDIPDINCQTPLMRAIDDCNYIEVADLLRKGANPNVWINTWSNPLLLSARLGERKIIKILVDAGADSRAALKATIQYREKHMAQILIDNGADTSNLTNEEIQQLQEWDLLPDLGG